MKTQTTPKIYVACLKAYNNGRLHGEWIDADQSEDELNEAVQTMLKASPEHSEDEPCEEFAIHDYEGFGSLEIGEYTSLETIAEHAALLSEFGEDAWSAYCDHVGVNYATAKDFKDKYLGEAESEKEFIENYYYDNGSVDELPEWARNNIDWEGLAYDEFIETYYFSNGHVFYRD
jgi:antirestriction protein